MSRDNRMENKIISMDSDDAAKFTTGIEGWVSSDGTFFGKDEDAARYHGCTHWKCEECGCMTSKAWAVCETCRDKNEIKRYENREKRVWNGNVPMYSETLDYYFVDFDNDVLDAAIEEFEDLRLVICDPVFLHAIESEYWIDDLPEDGELPQEIMYAVEALNEKLSNNCPVSWLPGKYAAVIEKK